MRHVRLCQRELFQSLPVLHCLILTILQAIAKSDATEVFMKHYHKAENRNLQRRLSHRAWLLCLLTISPITLAEFGGPVGSPDKSTGFNANSEQAEAFLTAQEAFKPSLAVNIENEQLSISWEIAPHYYLYEHSIKIELIEVAGKSSDITGLLDSSPSLRTTDPHLGQIKVFYNEATYQLLSKKAQLDVKSPEIASIRVEYEGCASNGLCYETQEAVFAVK